MEDDVTSDARLGTVPWRRVAFSLAVAAAILAVTTLSPSHTTAQSTEATPVNPAECTVAPLPRDSLVALLQAPPGLMRPGRRGTPIATPAPPTDGVPADVETTERVTATARQLIACLNAGELARYFALYSDEYLVAVWGGVAGPDLSGADLEEQVRLLETAYPLPADQQFSLVAVEDVRLLPDGRVLATVINNRSGSRAIFVKSGDRYLLDGAYALPGTSTPTP